MSSSPIDPVALMGSILEKEKKSKELRDAPFSPTIASELHELLHRIRKEYRLLIVEFPGFNSEKKDVMGLFWKNCFYKHIEEFRKSIKKLKGQLDVNRFNQKLANHMNRLCQEFLAFLNDSAKFIQKLMGDLERKAVEVATKIDKEYYDQLVNGVYRCLLYLGDLARYKELYSEQEHKDFTESVRYYERAALLMPSSGNPHNQLAMLATYNEAESTALYHYCRSVLTQNPFSGGFENLARLFALNKNSYDTLHQQIQAQNSNNSSSLNPHSRQHSHHQNRKMNEHLKFKFLLTSFVRLHGLLFAWTIRMHMEFLQTAEGMSQDSLESSTLLIQMNDSLTKTILGNKTDVDYEEIQELIFSILQEFDDVIYTSKLTDLHLLRFITISMFSVHFAEMPSAGLFNDTNFSTFLQHHTSSTPSVQSPISFSHAIAHRTIIQSLSLSAIYAIVTRAAIKLSNQLQGNTSENGSKRIFMEKVMPMLTVFSEWLVNHPSLLQPAKEMESRATDAVNPPSVFLEMGGAGERLSVEMWRSRYCVRRESARLEARARSSMRSALSILKEMWEKDTMQPVRDTVITQEGEIPTILLREHAELRGYLPLNEQLERYFLHFDPLRKTINWMTDAKARALRQEIILDFISQVLLAESKEIENSPLAQSHMLTPNNLNRKETREYLKVKKAANAKQSPTPVVGHKKKQQEKEKKKMNGHQERSPSELKVGNDLEELENVDDELVEKGKMRLVERDFPSLPGGVNTATIQANDFWKGLKTSLDKPGEEKISPVEVIEEDLNERWMNGVTDDLGDEVFEDDFEDVVFQPSFKRFVDQTPSPFSNAPASTLPLPHRNGSNPFLLGAENLSFTSSPTVSALLGQQEQQDDVVANDILTSLGISKNKSSSQLSDGGKLPLATVTSASNDLWEKLGVSGVNGAVTHSRHSFSADWNDVLTGNGLSSDWENPYQLDRNHVASNSALLFPPAEATSAYVPPPGISTLHSSPTHTTPFHLPTSNIVMTSPPGLTPSKTSHPVVHTAPPGLLRAAEVRREETEKTSHPPLPRSNDFLSYLNASSQSSWKT